MVIRHSAILCIAAALCLMGIFSNVSANESRFEMGPVFTTMGPIASVEADMKIPKRAGFAVAFDAAKAGEVGKLNRSLETAARFMNMHVASGVKKNRIKIAIIVHGSASFDLLDDSAYTQKYEGESNANKNAIKALTDEGIRIILCGQSAAYHGIENTDLLPGVEMALSAMTAHALLQQQGYTLNPF